MGLYPTSKTTWNSDVYFWMFKLFKSVTCRPAPLMLRFVRYFIKNFAPQKELFNDRAPIVKKNFTKSKIYASKLFAQ